MSKKEQAPKETKQPKTIKVRTLVIAIVLLIALYASFIFGRYTEKQYNNRVQAEAQALITSLTHK